MPIEFGPTKDGGREARGETAFGRFHARWDAHGRLVSESLELAEPAEPAPQPAAQRDRAAHRAAICRTCEQARSVTLRKNGWPVHRVDCRACGCGGLSLTDPASECPKDKWGK